MKKVLGILLLLLLSGCWNYQELNEYAIVTGMAVDYQDNRYQVSFLIANGNKSAEENSTNTSLLSGEGETIYQAMKDVSLESPKELYISHLSVVIFSESLAKEGIHQVLDFLLRDPQSHQNFYLLIAKDTKPSNILSILSPLADYPSQNIASNIVNSSKLQGKISDASFNLFVQKYLEKGFEPIMNSVIILGDIEAGKTSDSQEKSEQDAITKLDSLALFKGDKFVGYATQEESIGIDLVLGEIGLLYFNVPCQDSYAVTVSDNYDISYHVEKDKIELQAKVKGSLREVECRINLEEEKEIEKLEKAAEEELRQYMVHAIQLAKNYETDIFGIGAKYKEKYPEEFSKIKDWNAFFKDYPVSIAVDFKYHSKGTLEQSLERKDA